MIHVLEQFSPVMMPVIDLLQELKVTVVKIQVLHFATTTMLYIFV